MAGQWVLELSSQPSFAAAAANLLTAGEFYSPPTTQIFGSNATPRVDTRKALVWLDDFESSSAESPARQIINERQMQPTTIGAPIKADSSKHPSLKPSKIATKERQGRQAPGGLGGANYMPEFDYESENNFYQQQHMLAVASRNRQLNPIQQHKNKKPVYAPISQQTVNGLLSLLFLFVISTFGCIGTIFIMSALTVIGSLQTRGNCFLVSLALSHLLVTLLVIPSSALQIMAGESMNGPQLCHYQWLTLEFSLIVSQLSFLLIAADNYLGYKSSEKVTTSAQLSPECFKQSLQSPLPDSCAHLSLPTRADGSELHTSKASSHLMSKQWTDNEVASPGQRFTTDSSIKASAFIDANQATADALLAYQSPGEKYKLRLAKQFANQANTKLEPTGCFGYRNCCGRLKVLIWILLVWLFAIVYTFHRHGHSYGPHFCATAPHSAIKTNLWSAQSAGIQRLLPVQQRPSNGHGNQSAHRGASASIGQVPDRRLKRASQVFELDDAAAAAFAATPIIAVPLKLRKPDEQAMPLDDRLIANALPEKRLQFPGNSEEAKIDGSRGKPLNRSGNPLGRSTTMVEDLGLPLEANTGLASSRAPLLPTSSITRSPSLEAPISQSGAGQTRPTYGRFANNQVSLGVEASYKQPHKSWKMMVESDSEMYDYMNSLPTDAKQQHSPKRIPLERLKRTLKPQKAHLPPEIVGHSLVEREGNENGIVWPRLSPDNEKQIDKRVSFAHHHHGKVVLVAVRRATNLETRCDSCHRNKRARGQQRQQQTRDTHREKQPVGASKLILPRCAYPKVADSPTRYAASDLGARNELLSGDEFSHGNRSSKDVGRSTWDDNEELKRSSGQHPARVGLSLLNGDNSDLSRVQEIDEQVGANFRPEKGQHLTNSPSKSFKSSIESSSKFEASASSAASKLASSSHTIAKRLAREWQTASGKVWPHSAKESRPAQAPTTSSSAPSDSSRALGEIRPIEARSSGLDPPSIPIIASAGLMNNINNNNNYNADGMQTEASKTGAPKRKLGRQTKRQPSAGSSPSFMKAAEESNKKGSSGPVESINKGAILDKVPLPVGDFDKSSWLARQHVDHIRQHAAGQRQLGSVDQLMMNDSTQANKLPSNNGTGSPSATTGEPSSNNRSAGMGQPKFYWFMLFAGVMFPSLASTILFARAYLRMKEFKMRPYKPMPVAGLNSTLPSLLLPQSPIPLLAQHGGFVFPQSKQTGKKPDENIIDSSQLASSNKPLGGLSHLAANRAIEPAKGKNLVNLTGELGRDADSGRAGGELARNRAIYRERRKFSQPVGGSNPVKDIPSSDQQAYEAAKPSSHGRSASQPLGDPVGHLRLDQASKMRRPSGSCNPAASSIGQHNGAPEKVSAQLARVRLHPQVDHAMSAPIGQNGHYQHLASQPNPVNRHYPEEQQAGGGLVVATYAQQHSLNANTNPPDTNETDPIMQRDISFSAPPSATFRREPSLEQIHLTAGRGSNRRDSQRQCEFERHQEHARSFHYGSGARPYFKPADSRQVTDELQLQLELNQHYYQQQLQRQHNNHHLNHLSEQATILTDQKHQNHHLSPVSSSPFSALPNHSYQQHQYEHQQRHILERHRSLPRSSRLYQSDTGQPHLATPASKLAILGELPHLQAEHHPNSFEPSAHLGAPKAAGESQSAVAMKALENVIKSMEGSQSANSLISAQWAPAGPTLKSLELNSGIDQTAAFARTLGPNTIQRANKTTSSVMSSGGKSGGSGDGRGANTKAILCTYSYMTDDQLLKSNIIVFLLNLVLWLPFVLLSIASQYRDHLTQELKDAVWWMATLNCCSCSYVYALTNKDFREAFNKLFYYCCCKSHVTFQQKTPIFRRQLDLDSKGNLRIHIIPGLNLYSNKLGGKPNDTPTQPVSQDHQNQANNINASLPIS